MYLQMQLYVACKYGLVISPKRVVDQTSKTVLSDYVHCVSCMVSSKSFAQLRSCVGTALSFNSSRLLRCALSLAASAHARSVTLFILAWEPRAFFPHVPFDYIVSAAV